MSAAGPGRLLGLAERASLYAVWAGGAMVIFSAFLVTFDVFARKFFNWSMAGSDEISGYTFGISTVWALSFTLLHRAHVRVDALYLRFGPRMRLVLDLVGMLALGGFMALLAWQAWDVFLGSWERDARSISPMQTRLWIPQFFWFAGLAVFIAVFSLILLRSVAALAAGDAAGARRLIGARTVDEDVAEELAGTAAIAERKA